MAVHSINLAPTQQRAETPKTPVGETSLTGVSVTLSQKTPVDETSSTSASHHAKTLLY
jgi:hypothetical protein